jgi:hypothetical protein
VLLGLTGVDCVGVVAGGWEEGALVTGVDDDRIVVGSVDGAAVPVSLQAVRTSDAARTKDGANRLL